MLAAGRRPLRLALVVLVVLALGSCGTNKDNDVVGGITVQEFAFSPIRSSSTSASPSRW